MKIALISCVSKKLKNKAKAEEMYISPLFRYNLNYAKSIADKIFIISAKYGLLELKEEIEPYEKTLNNISEEERKGWAINVLSQLKEKTNLEKDEFIFLAGEKYRKYLIPEIKNYKIPLKGLGIGRQLEYLKNKDTSERCKKLHEIFNKMKRNNFPFNEAEIPENGIYVLFQNDEKAHDVDRIVRIGTHTGLNQLKSRLKQHFINENKDRSIFRKNIGRALLNKDKDKFLEKWELDLTTKDAKEKFSDEIDFNKQKEMERKVSKYIQENFSFVVFPVDDKEKRLELESKIISTISLCNNCKPSTNWLGNFSPKEKIRKSGLWLVNELNKEPLSDTEIENLTQFFK